MLHFDEETIRLTSFSSDEKLYAFIEGFYGLKGLPNYFTKQMYTFFQKLIDQSFALVYIDDKSLLSHSKSHMIELIEQLHQIWQKNALFENRGYTIQSNCHFPNWRIHEEWWI